MTHEITPLPSAASGAVATLSTICRRSAQGKKFRYTYIQHRHIFNAYYATTNTPSDTGEIRRTRDIIHYIEIYGGYVLKTQEPLHPRTLIVTDLERCVGCNRCIRVCPVETANLLHLDKDGSIKVRVDTTQCIACGACEHGARHYVDDCNAFLLDLRAGLPLNLIVAPSVRTHVPEWERLFSWLRACGVRLICDVSVSADICVWAHVRYMERNPSRRLITQPCPTIVAYCERSRHELLADLSPIHSPMLCTAIYLRHYAHVEGPIAALSPALPRPTNSRQQALSATTLPFLG